VGQADADDTAVISLVLARQPDGHCREAARGGLHHLLALQNDDGGFPTYAKGDQSEVEITAKCVSALLHSPLAVESEAAVYAAWRWVVDQQRADGGFRNEWNLSPVFPVMHVLRAAQAVRAHTSLDTSSVEEGGAAFLAASVLPGGGWALTPEAAEPHGPSTSYAVAGLAALRRRPHQILETAAWLLLDGEAGRSSAPDSLGPRPFVYDVPLLHPVYRLAALSALNGPGTDESRNVR
jgi:prenyltransferase beta subunit